MNKKDLEYLRTHAATGEVFNQQLISTQIETIYSLNKLESTIKNANKKNDQLEKSNQRLQAAMFGLTMVTTITALFGLSENILRSLGLSGFWLVTWSGVIASGLTYLVSIILSREIEKW